MKSLDDLKNIKEKAYHKVALREDKDVYQVIVGMDVCGLEHGAKQVLQSILEEVENKQYDCYVLQGGCLGFCEVEPVVTIVNLDGSFTVYENVSEESVKEILASHIGQGVVVDKYLHKEVGDCL